MIRPLCFCVCGRIPYTDIMETPSSYETEPPSPALELFRAAYCDPERPVIELHRGEVARYPAILFQGQTDDRLIILRSGMQGNEQLFWLGAFDLAKNEQLVFDVANRETAVRSFTGHSSFDNLYELKSRSDETKTVLFRMASHALEWTENGVKKDVALIPPDYS